MSRTVEFSHAILAIKKTAALCGFLKLGGEGEILSRIKKPATVCGFSELGGEGGIRTPGRFDPSPDFKSGALNRALPPLQVLRILMI